MIKVLVLTPSFVADCLETIVEIGEEYKEKFENSPGKQLDLVDSLNTSPQWVEALVKLIKG